MNSVQRAIAGITGLDEVMVAQEGQLTELRTEYDTLYKAHEEIYSSFTLISRRLEDMMYIDLSQSGTIPGGKDEIISDEQRKAVLNRLRRLRHENPLAKQAIKLTLRFVFGKNISFEAEEDQDQKILEACWRDRQNQQVFTGRNTLVSWWDEELTDGEKFLVMVSAKDNMDQTQTAAQEAEVPTAKPPARPRILPKDDDPEEEPELPTANGGPPYVRFGEIPLEEISQILYDPDNWRIPVWYARTFIRQRFDPDANGGQGAWLPVSHQPETLYYRDFRVSDDQLADIESRGLRIPKSKQGVGRIKHMFVNPVRMKSGIRGVSELFASREWFRVFKEFMEDRGAINAAANALAFQRRIKGGPAAVARLTGKVGGVDTGTSNVEGEVSPFDARRLTRPMAGSIYDTTDTIDLKGVRLDTGAPNANLDARMLLMAAGSGVATPINYFGDVNASLAGTQSVELPLVKNYEDMQASVKAHLQDIAEFIISEARGEEVEPGSIRIAWEFPPIITADIVKWITAWAQLAQQIAPGNQAVKRIAIRGGLVTLNVPNVDVEMEKVDEEEKRIFAEKEEERNLNIEMRKNPPDQPVSPSTKGDQPDSGPDRRNGRGQNSGGGEKPFALNADQLRLTRGRPPRETTTGPRSRRQ